MKLLHFILFIILLITFISCKGNIIDSKIKDINTGTYQLQGTKIDKQLCYVSNICKPGEVLQADTSEITFEIGVEYLLGSADSLRFRNLQGADTGKDRVTQRGKSYAKLNAGNLTFDIEEPGGSYFGNGYIAGGKVSLNTTYYYRTVEIEYNLTGEKIDDEVLR